VRGSGTLISLSRTGARVNKVPQYALTLSIKVEGREPYQAVTKNVLGPAAAASLTPGARLPVRVHPKDPRSCVLEAD
jgi:hypothetical protein